MQNKYLLSFCKPPPPLTQTDTSSIQNAWSVAAPGATKNICIKLEQTLHLGLNDFECVEEAV